jgi:hypothetical protein
MMPAPILPPDVEIFSATKRSHARRLVLWITVSSAFIAAMAWWWLRP